MKRLRTWFSGAARSEEGTATIPFVIFVPFFLTLVIASMEMGLLMVRSVMLERGLDMAVRDLRLGLNGSPTYNDLKKTICRNAGIIPNCLNTMHLELRRVSKVTWQPLSSGPTCVNRIENPNPLVQFETGTSNDMMLIRACVKFRPMFALNGVVFNTSTLDSAGDYALVSATAFVNEPRLGS